MTQTTLEVPPPLGSHDFDGHRHDFLIPAAIQVGLGSRGYTVVDVNRPHSSRARQESFCLLTYAGFEFGCTWDEEYGLGVLMHGTRTVEIGGADRNLVMDS